MKRFFSLLLVLMLLVGSAVAESEMRTFTADEQAYDAYLDIEQAYADGVFYLEELGVLWSKVIETGSNEKIDYLWFSDYLLADTNRFKALLLYSTSVLDISEAEDLINYLASNAETRKEKTDTIWMCLSMLKDANYVEDAESIKQNLDSAMAGIRSLMATDREYPFLKDLQTYYKDAVLLYEYIADFNDNYTGFTAKLDEFQKNKTSWEVDFEFIYNPDDFDYVREVRNAEKAEEIEAIYQQAVELESNGKYSEAIELYKKCGNYSHATERIVACQAASKDLATETQYNNAINLIEQRKYAEALVLLAEIATYKDSKDLIEQCQESIPVKSMQIDTYMVGKKKELVSSTITYYEYNEKGHLIASSQKGADVPTKEEYVTDENGNIVSSTESGPWGSSNSGSFVSRKTYNEHGDVIREETEYKTSNNSSNKAVPYITTYQYTYDDIGRITEYESEYFDLRNKYRYEYILDESGKIIEKKTFMNGNELTTSTYTYNQYGLLELEVVKGVPNAASLYSLEEYKYVYDFSN